jgi:hypothetical protein
MPIPGSGFKTEVLIRLEMTGKGAEEADSKENGSDDDVEAMKAGGHEKRRAVDVAAVIAAEGEGGMSVFVSLD